MNSERGIWGSRLGFILAASGSAIGLGNIVFFSANAYKYGGGAFYVPYLVALFVIGLPIMTLEFGLGRFTGRAFPAAMNKIGGRRAELAGWFGIFNASIITMYYITILGWVFGCFLGSFGAHKFYLGNTPLGVLYLVFCWAYVPGIVGFIEGIYYLTLSDEQFAEKYG